MDGMASNVCSNLGYTTKAIATMAFGIDSVAISGYPHRRSNFCSWSSFIAFQQTSVIQQIHLENL